MKIYFLLILTVVIFQSCDNSGQPDNTPEIIDLKQAFESKQTATISTIAQSIEYIQLETREECIVGNNPKIYANEKYLIIFGKQIFIFNREDGKFIREIGKYGRGPDEH